MLTYGADSSSQDCVIDLPAGTCENAQQLEEYVSESTQKLNSIAENVSRGEKVDRDTHDWMLSQVDFLVETVGNESLELNDEIRSNLLQLLLAIANLNEEIRHQASLSL
jgi:uncharacterized protein HemX